MRDTRRSIAVGLFILLFALPFFPSSSSLNAEESDAPVTLEQCRDQLLSGDFVVVDQKNLKPMPHVARQLARTVQDMIDKKGSKDEPKARERFDRTHDDVMRRIMEGRWGIDETSENILDDCYYGLHPEADPAN